MIAWAAALTGVGAAALVAAFSRPVLRRLPEPVEVDGSVVADKIPYARLATPTFVITLTVMAGVLVAFAAAVVPPAAVPQWFVLGTIGLVLAGVDARTTWLPLPLTRIAWGLAAVAAALGGFVVGARGETLDLLTRTALGAAAAWALFGLVWLLSRGGIGFGDVRYAPLIGAAAGSQSNVLILWALLLGALVGGGYGVVRLLRRRRDPFPYAPSLFAGAWLALGLQSLSG